MEMHHHQGGCPGSRMMTFDKSEVEETPVVTGKPVSRLNQWPCQIKLLPTVAPFYDGAKLLSLKDINGQVPEIYLATSNRSAGKTTYFGRWAVKRFLEHGEKFGLIYRFNYELTDVADKFFRELKQLFFPDQDMTSKNRAKGIYHELFLML